MTTLLRYNLRKNSGVLFNKNWIKKFILKERKKKIKLNLIENEYKGYCWYLQKLKKKKNFFIIEFKKENYLKLKIIKGYKYKFWENFIYRKKQIYNIFQHYNEIWPSKNKVPFHGDLTLDNILFLKDKKPIFIDWENFNEEEDWGLDICYFLISIIALPALTLGRKKISEKQIYLFKNYWNSFFKKKKFHYLNDPVKCLKKKIKDKKNFIFKLNLNIKRQIISAISLK